jgi:hypothetical protein
VDVPGAANVGPPRSVVVPAHDEGPRIAALLEALTCGDALADAVVVVACNGCRDDTVARARAVAVRRPGRVVVLDLPVPSKAAAIRAAEAVCAPGARLYLDADVTCDASTAAALLDAVDGVGAAPVAVPRRELRLGRASVPARAYYRFWADLPWVRSQLGGRGAYALSWSLRSQLGEFPDLVADDRWATTRCAPGEGRVVDAAVGVEPASRVRDLVRVRSRIYAGNLHGAVPSHDVGGSARALALLRYSAVPARWPGLVVFTAVAVTAKVRAKRRARTAVSWARDPGRDTPAR